MYANCKFYYLTSTLSKIGKITKNIKGYAYPHFESDEERFDLISGWAIEQIIEKHSSAIETPYVAIEGYAYGATGQVFNIAENCGMLKHKLYKKGIDFHVVAPTTIKKFATGKGNANKEMMYESWLQETDHNIHTIISPKSKSIGNPVSDIVDSYFIARYLHQNLVLRRK